MPSPPPAPFLSLVRLDAESSSAPFLSLVRPGDRTSFIPSAREAGEFIARTDTLLHTQKTPSISPLKGENQKSPFKTPSGSL